MKKFTIISLILTVFVFTTFAQNTEQLYEQGRKEYKAGSYTKSIKTLSKVINKSSFYYEAYAYRARAYHALQMEDSALLDFNTSISKNPKYLVAYYYRGVYYFDLKDYEKAISDFSHILQKKPDYAKALSYRGQSYEAINKDKMALADYTHSIKSGTKNFDLYYRRALLYKKHNELKLADYDLGKAIQYNSDCQEAYSLRGVIKVARGHYEKSIGDLSKAIEMNPDDQAALEARAKAYLETEQLDKALADYNVLVVKFHTRNVEVYMQRGELFVSQGEYSKASKDFARTSRIDPGNDQALVENAKVYLLRGRAQQSIPISRKAIHFNDKNWEAWYVRGKAYFDLNQFQNAEKDFNKSIELKPSAQAHYYRGQCRAERRELMGACEDLKTAEKMGFELATEDLKHVCK